MLGKSGSREQERKSHDRGYARHDSAIQNAIHKHLL
jgi:hypothetical protein